jgi:hypothetical protein
VNCRVTAPKHPRPKGARFYGDFDKTWTLNRFGKYPMSVGEQVSWTILPAIDPQDKTVNEVAALVEESIRKEFMRRNVG